MISQVSLSESERQRAGQVDALAARREEGVPGLLALLTDPSWTVRRAVVAALGALGDAALDGLAQVLHGQRDDETRLAAAVDALVASTGHPEAWLDRLAHDPNPAVAADAAQILGRRRDPKGVPLLIELVRHPDDNVAVTALEGLGRVGGRAAVSALLEALHSGNFFRVFPAIDVLGRSGDPRAVPALASLLDTLQYQLEAARALGRTGEKAAAAPLASLLGRRGDGIIRVAALSLSELIDQFHARFGATAALEAAIRRASPGPTVRNLGQALAGADPVEQGAICRVLGLLGQPAAAPILARVLEGTAGAVSHAAADALRRLGQASEGQLREALRAGDSARRQILLPVMVHAGATAEVVACLADPDPAVRALACEALGRIGNPAAAGALFTLLGEENPRVGQAALAAIQSLGSAEVERRALAAARSEAPRVRRAALRILAYFGYGSALETFLTALRDEDPRARDAALQGLSFLEDPRALEALLEAARSESAALRAGAVRVLGNETSVIRASGALLRALRDPEPWVRYHACQSLGRLRFTPAVQAVVPLLADPAGQVRVAAVEALSHFQSEDASRALREAARSEDADVQRAALVGLGLGRREEDLEGLLQAAGAVDPATRLVAVSALSSFLAPPVLPALLRAARDPDENVRTAAVSFLSARPGAQATRALVDLLLDVRPREEALAALSVGTEGRVEGLLAALETADDELAPLLTASLARLIGSEPGATEGPAADASAALLQALESPNVPARKAAASTLGALGSRAALEALRRHADLDPDPELRRICALLIAA